MTTRTPGGTLTLSRMGYGAMQLAGPEAFGPPKDHDEAVAVLREAVELGGVLPRRHEGVRRHRRLITRGTTLRR